MIAQSEVMRKRMIDVIMFQAKCVNEIAEGNDIWIGRARLSAMLELYNAALGEESITVTWERKMIVSIETADYAYRWDYREGEFI